MKICIVSDSHDHRDRLAAAVKAAKADGAEAVLHCGDVVAPSTLHAIQPFGLPMHVIHGNNIGDSFHMSKLANDPGSNIHYYGMDAKLELGGRRIYMVHYPHLAKAMALTGDWDIVCNGHEHKACIEHIKNIKGGETLRIDPGTVAGISGHASYVIGDLSSLTFKVCSVS